MESLKVIYKTEMEVYGYDVDFQCQMNVYRLIELLHDAAGVHATKLNCGWKHLHEEGLFWALSKFHIVMHRYPKWGEKITIYTWPKQKENLIFLRDYEVYSQEGELLASALSEWMIVNYKVNRIMRMDQVQILVDFPEQRDALPYRVAKLPRVPFPENPTFQRVHISDLDMNHHVNNVNYIRWIIDRFPYSFYQENKLKQLTINYSFQLKADQLYTFGETEEIPLNFNTTIYNEEQKEVAKVATVWVPESQF